MIESVVMPLLQINVKGAVPVLLLTFALPVGFPQPILVGVIASVSPAEFPITMLAVAVQRLASVTVTL